MPQNNPTDAIKIRMSGSMGGANNDNIVLWTGIVTPTAGQNFSIPLTGANFTTITNIQITPQSSSSSILNLPLVIIQSYTLTQITVSLVVSGSVGVLVGGVIQGLAYATNLAGIQLHVRVEGT